MSAEDSCAPYETTEPGTMSGEGDTGIGFQVSVCQPLPDVCLNYGESQLNVVISDDKDEMPLWAFDKIRQRLPDHLKGRITPNAVDHSQRGIGIESNVSGYRLLGKRINDISVKDESDIFTGAVGSDAIDQPGKPIPPVENLEIRVGGLLTAQVKIGDHVKFCKDRQMISHHNPS